jgi:predicted DNA-binding transcriptional regulator AlpA
VSPSSRAAKAAKKAAGRRDELRSEARVRLMSRRELLDRVPVSYATIWKLMRSGEFPRSRRIGGKVVWVESEVEAWIDNLTMPKLKGDEEKEKPAG